MRYNLQSPMRFVNQSPEDQELQERLTKRILAQKRRIRRNQLRRRFSADAQRDKIHKFALAIKGIKEVSWHDNMKAVRAMRYTPIKQDDWFEFVGKQCAPEIDHGYLDANVMGETNKNVGHTRNSPVFGKVDTIKRIIDYIEYLPVIDDEILDIKIKVSMATTDPYEICDEIFRGLKELRYPCYSQYGAQDNIQLAPDRCYQRYE